MKTSLLLAVTAAITIYGFATTNASAWQLTRLAVENQTDAAIILVGAKRKAKRRTRNKAAVAVSKPRTQAFQKNGNRSQTHATWDDWNRCLMAGDPEACKRICAESTDNCGKGDEVIILDE